MKNILIVLLSIAIQSVVTFYYFNYFGVTWQSVIPLFIVVNYLKNLMEIKK